MAPRKRPRPKLLDILAEREARRSWAALEPAALLTWLCRKHGGGMYGRTR